MSDITKEDVLNAQKDPVRFIQHFFGVELWGKQRDIANALVDNRVVGIRSCHGSGKTFMAAQIALWWVLTRPYSTVVTTAPTGRQVNELLWKEIRKSFKNAKSRFEAMGMKIGGEMLPKAPKLTIDDDWLCIGFSTDDPTSFQGWHSPGGVLAVFDEAPGVAPDIWDAVQGVIVGENDRLLCIGNPTETSGPFYDMFNKENSAKTFHISAYDVPNVKQGKTVIPGLCTREWVEDRKKEWMENTPMWQSRVLGNFPDTSDATVIPLSWAEEAASRFQKQSKKSIGPMVMSVDVARFGADTTVFAFADENGVKEMITVPKCDTMETVGHVLKSFEERGGFERITEIRVDADGLGAGVFDRLNEQLGSITVEMRGGMRAENNERYLNRRAEWYFTLRELLDPDSDNPIFIPNNQKLIAQLSSIKWKINSRGLIQIESKEDMKKRGVKSPDEADAVVMAMSMQRRLDFFFV